MQAESTTQTCFKEKTDTFSLNVTIAENRLSVCLKDYVDWVIYSKQYNEQDIGKDIHKKMDIEDVYTAFSQTSPTCDQKNTKQKQIEFRGYKFGTVLTNDSFPCYKIDKGGRITTFQIIFDKNKNQVVYQSQLKLNKERNMTEIEIFTQKSTVEKRNIYEQFNSQIDKQKREKESLLDKIQMLKENYQDLKKYIEKIGNQGRDICEQQQIISNNNQISKQILKAEVDKLKSQNQKLESQSKDNLNKIQELQEKLSAMENALNNKNQKLEIKHQENSDKIQELLQTVQSMKITQSFYILQQDNKKYFNFDGLRIRFIGNDGQWTHYLFHDRIYSGMSAKFKLKIIKTQKRNMEIGIVDYYKQRSSRYSWNSGNALCYHGYDGKKRPENISEGGGFKQGDIVQVQINRGSKTINYFINSELKATQRNQMLGDTARIFVPFIDVTSVNDEVEWVIG